MAHGFPAMLSLFIPGSGQLVKGQVVKGLMIMIAMVFSALLVLVMVGVVTTPLLWLWNIYDAYNN